jgi:hypothetical protein
VGAGRHPFKEEALPCEVLDLGENIHAPLPDALKAKASRVLLDQWEASSAQIQALRPLKIAVMEDDGDAHDSADLLFQPYLEGVKWDDRPVRTVKERKLRPYEEHRGSCRVLKGSNYIVLGSEALQLRPKREPMQPLAVHKLLISFGGTDGPGLSQRAFQVLSQLVRDKRWEGSCTLLAPNGIEGKPFPGCTVLPGLANLTRRIPEYDALWCAAGLTLAESLCIGVPVAAWGQNDRQTSMIGDLARGNACFSLGLGPEADLEATAEALARWLGPEGQENRQEQSRDGRTLIDGMGATRVAQELWNLAK